MKRRKSYIFSSSVMITAAIGILLGIVILVVNFVSRIKTSSEGTVYTGASIGNVLYINSYDPGYIVSKFQLKGLDEAMSKSNILYEVMYMDMLNYDTRENYDNFYKSIKYKISVQKNKFDAVIVSDDAALGFVEQYHEELFPGLPVVFFGINNLDYARKVSESPFYTGFAEEIFVEDTLEILVEQNPKVGRIVCICDDSVTGLGDIKQFARAMEKYPNLDYEFLNLNRFSPPFLSKYLTEIPLNSVIVCLSSLQSYAHFNGIGDFELVDFITSYAKKIPIYRTHIIGIGAGFVGGKIFNHVVAAENAVKKLRDILLSHNLENIPLTYDKQGMFLFDYSVLKKLKLNLNAIPDDAVFVNRPENFFDVYRDVILPFVLISVSLVMLLIVAAANYTKSKRINSVMMIMNKRMRQTNKDLIDSKTKLTYVANNDGLTELPNRVFGEQEIRHIMHSGVPFSLFLMDIDDFKNYNDTYTHACGDFVLKEYGRRLAKLTQNNEYFAARYGGDEFILVHKCGHIEKNGKEIEELKKLLDEPLEYNGITLDITATLGYANSDPDLSYDDLITNADIAMYEAKKEGNGAIVAFMADMKENMVRRNKIMEIIKDECSSGGFEIRYQPQVFAGSGEVYGYEALVRLQNHPIGPGEFIPIAEDSGFITQIGRIVVEKVLAQMDVWRKEGMPLKKVAINYSNGQLVDDEYVKFLKREMDKYTIPPELIEIEITESLFMGKKERASQLFNDLADIGVSLALDDFGTGYSSLSYLTFVPAKKVKIDKTLVDNYLVDGKETFIENIVHLVHDLGMKLTVEGVEHKWQYDKLCAMNCDYIQGYFFSKPMTADSVPQFSVGV